jgi:NhaA family Na+:H+ antiporter
LFEPIALGVALGLFVGKQIGVFGVTWLAIGCGSATCRRMRPCGSSTACRCCCGIGFTMSLFIGLLAFPTEAMQEQVKIGVLAGSLLSALVGVAVLMGSKREAVPTPSARGFG